MKLQLVSGLHNVQSVYAENNRQGGPYSLVGPLVLAL